MIHPKYYKLVEEATKRFEMEEENNAVGSLDDTDTSDQFDENIQVIFATEDTVNKLCENCVRSILGGLAKLIHL